MRPETKLARVFNDLVDGGKKLDSVASGILAIVAEARVRSVDEFNPLVSAAYEANGWNPRPGRPSAETKDKDEVPGTVRTYVTTVRRAFRRGISVAACKNFYELRQALRKTKARRRGPLSGLDKDAQGNFAGVEIVEVVDDLNGALIHDVGVVYARLPKDQQPLFEKQLQKLMNQYMPHARGIKIIQPREPEEQDKVAAAG